MFNVRRRRSAQADEYAVWHSASAKDDAYVAQRRVRVEQCRHHRTRYLAQQGVLASSRRSRGGSLAGAVRRVAIAAVAGLVGCVTLSASFDTARLIRVDSFLVAISYWSIALGAALGIVAAVASTINWILSPRGTPRRGLSSTIALGSVFVSTFATLSWMLRSGSAVEPGVLALLLSFMAAGVAIVTAVLTGDLIGSDRGDRSTGSTIPARQRRRAQRVDPDHSVDQVAVRA